MILVPRLAQFIFRPGPSEKAASAAVCKMIKFSSAAACTFGIPLLDRRYSILPASTSLKLMRGVLLIALAYRICKIYFTGAFPKNKTDALNDVFSGCVNDAAELTLITAVNLSYPYFFVHESGHYACAKAFFLEKEGKYHVPHKMNIAPFVSGNTEYSISLGLTKIGQYMGKEGSLLMTMAGGMFASTLYSCGNILLSRAMHRAGRYIFHQACSQSIQEFLYQSRFFLFQGPASHHDLSQLKRRFQINPLYPLLAMGIAPVLTFRLSSRYFETRKSALDES